MRVQRVINLWRETPVGVTALTDVHNVVELSRVQSCSFQVAELCHDHSLPTDLVRKQGAHPATGPQGG